MWRVQVAADVAELDQLRQLALARRLQLAAALAQLRLDVGVAEALVDLLLGRAELDLAALGLGDPVLGDREAAGDRVLAQLHVVGLGAGEVLQQVAEGLRAATIRRSTEIAVVGLGAHAVGARFAGGGDQRVAGEVLGQRRRLLGGGDQVDVLAGLGPAPHRAGDLDPVGRRVLAQRRGQLLGDRPHRREQQRGPGASPGSPSRSSAARTFSSTFGPSPFSSRILSPSAAAFRSSSVATPSSSKRRRAVFAPRPGDPGHLDQGRRELRLQLHRGGDLAGLQQGVDLFRQRLADAGDLGRPPRARPARRPRPGSRGSPWRRCCRRAPGI